MKKYLLILVALIGFGISANAQNRSYTVTVNTLKTLHYYSDATYTTLVGTSTVSGATQTITVCAKTSYEAEQKAIAECHTMCQRNCDKVEPKANFGGKSCWVTSSLEPSSTSVQANNQDC
ncbi:MAG: hypothetical protein LBS54_08845 [Dysgonamonadaceae bacterium]|jgi:hypothetical protein|nr:hypothetical protein [Dysgonamonadaceae bacterium]